MLCGAIEELTVAVREAAIAACDTVIDINETARELKDRGAILITAKAVEETAAAAKKIQYRQLETQ